MDTERYVEKLLDLSCDKSKTLKYLLKLVEDPESILPTKLLCSDHNQVDNFCFEQTCYFCDAKGCVECGELFRVDGRHMCYKCYEYKCVEFDECILYDGTFKMCDWCVGLGWNIGWIQKKDQ